MLYLWATAYKKEDHPQSSVSYMMPCAVLFQYALIFCTVQKDSKTVIKKKGRII